MTDETPQIYLVTPPQIDLGAFPDVLARLLDAHAVGCFRLDIATRDEDVLLRAADALRAVTEPRDVALVIADHWKLVERAGLDGVHLTDGARRVKTARADLGLDAIVGAFCGASRHDGLTAGEMGADYVVFGPAGGADLGGEKAPADLFAWWSEMIEIPVVAEGGIDEDCIANLWRYSDFICLGEEVWSHADPVSRLAALKAAMS